MRDNTLSFPSVVWFVVLFGALFVPDQAFAYIDPGLGGSLFQMFYLIFAGAILFVVSPILVFWKKVKGALRGRLCKDGKEKDEKNDIAI